MAPTAPPSIAFSASTVIVITGSSRGVGLQLAKTLLETTESKVVATARNIDKATALGELAAKFQGRVQLVTLDTESEESVKAAAAEVAKIHDGIDLLINNAAIDEGVNIPCLDVEPKLYEKILKVNVVGPFLTTTNFLPLLRNKQPRIVVSISSGIASIAANRSGKLGPLLSTRQLAYSSSKNSVLANQLKDEGFCFLALCPGFTDTDMGGTAARALGMETALVSVETSVKRQLEVIKSLTTENNGEFRDYEGKIEW